MTKASHMWNPVRHDLRLMRTRPIGQNDMLVYADATARDASLTNPVQGLVCYNVALASDQIYDGAGFWRTPNRHIAHDFDDDLSNIVAYWDASRGTDVAADNADVASWTDRVGAYAVTEGTNHPRLDVDGGPNGSRALACLQTDSEKLSSSDSAFDDLPEVTWGGWIYWSGDTTAGHAGIISKNGATRRLEVDTSDGSLLGTLEAATTNGQSQSEAAVITADTWTHVAMSAYAIGAREFIGSSSQQLDTDAATKIGTNDATVCGWMKHTSAGLGSNDSLVSGVTAGYSTIWDFRNNDSGQTKLMITDGAGGVNSYIASALSADTWYFFAITFDRDGNLNVYIDDMSTAVITADIGGQSSDDWADTRLYVGGKMGSSSYDGLLSRVGKCVGTVLNQTQLESIKNNSTGSKYADLTSSLQSEFDHYYDCVAASGEEIDQAGSQNLSATNAPLNGPGPDAPSDGRMVKLYVNGSEVSYASQTEADGGLDADASGDLQIGYSQAASDYFDGRIASVMVADTKLSDDQARAIHAGTRSEGIG